MDLETVHQLSLYELRRELTARDAWDLKDEDITYRNVLARAVALLVKEKEEKEQQVAATAPTTESVKERLEREKEERKKAAMERSRQRQAQPDYFKAKMECNKAAIVQPKEEAAAVAVEEQPPIETD